MNGLCFLLGIVALLFGLWVAANYAFNVNLVCNKVGTVNICQLEEKLP